MEGLLYNDDKKAGGNKFRTYRSLEHTVILKQNFCREFFLFTDIDSKKALQHLLKYELAIVTYILKEVDFSNS